MTDRENGAPRVPDPLPAPLPYPPDASAAEEISRRADSVRVRGDGRAPAIPRVTRQKLRGPGGRVAILDGCRTPFCKAGTDLAGADVVDLAGGVTAELVTRSGIDPEELDLAVYGVVVPALHAPNLGREVVLRASLPAKVTGTSVNLACASANRAMVTVAEAILLGEAEVGLAGGAESLSNVPVLFSRAAARRFAELARARSAGEKLRIAGRLRLKDLAPVPPAIAEYATGLTMGEACEKMAKENGVSRRAQDEIALLSHRRAAAAQAAGRFEGQLVPTFPPPGFDWAVLEDNGVRPDSTLDALAELPPVFDRRFGTLTAGNSSPITDGAAALLLASEKRAHILGVAPLGYLRSWAFAAVDPREQLLQGPAYAIPLALDRAGLRLSDLDLVEMHEAFAAQLLSNLKALASPRFAAAELGRAAPVGEVDLERLNVNGGSLALGHPFGATGARLALQLLRELERRGGKLGLLSVCAAGGHGFAMVVERD